MATDLQLPDRFDEALHVAHVTHYCVNQMGGVPAQDARRAAEQYLMDLRQGSSGFTLALNLIRHHSAVPIPSAAQIEAQSGGDVLQQLAVIGQDPSYCSPFAGHHRQDAQIEDLRLFWAFNTLMTVIPEYATKPLVSICSEEQLYQILFGWVRNLFLGGAIVSAASAVSAGKQCASTSALPPDFILNKHAQVLVIGLQVFYPLHWRTFFADLFSLSAEMAAWSDLLARSALASASPALDSLRRTISTVADVATLFVLKVFECIDERVVSNVCSTSVVDKGAAAVGQQNVSGVEKSREQRRRDMEVKDGMRIDAIPSLVNMWLVVLRSCHARCCEAALNGGVSPLAEEGAGGSGSHSEDVMRLCLVVMQLYVDWIDIDLVVTPEWIPILYYFTSDNCNQYVAIRRESEAKGIFSGVGSGLLAVALGAAEVLNRIVTKKQLPLVKYDTLVTRMDVASQCGRILTQSVAAMLEAWPDQVRSVSLDPTMMDLGDGGDDSHSINQFVTIASTLSVRVLRELCTIATSAGQQGGLDEASAAQCVALIHTLLPHVCGLFRVLQGNYTVREMVFPFLQLYIKSPCINEEEAAFILQILFEHALAPEGSKVDILGALAGGDDEERRGSNNVSPALSPHAGGTEEVTGDALSCWVEQRRAVFNLIRLLHRRDGGDLVMRHITTMVTQITDACGMCTDESPATVSARLAAMIRPADAEGVIRYAYELGETIKLEVALKPADSPMTIVLMRLLHSNLCHYPHSAVHLALFELYDRCFQLFIFHKTATVDALLRQFLLIPCGILNPAPKVRSRICYLFNHMTSLLKLQLQSHAPDVAKALLAIFEAQAEEQRQGGMANRQSSGAGGYGMGTGRSTPRCTQLPPHFLSAAEKCDLFEGIGTLLSVSDVYMCKQLTSNVLGHIVGVTGEGHTPDVVAHTIAEDVSFLAYLAKGVGGTDAAKVPDSPPLASATGMFPSVPSLSLPSSSGAGIAGPSPKVDPPTSPVSVVFTEVAKTVTAILESYAAFSLTLRDKACLFMHQLINILNADAADFVVSFANFMYAAIRSPTEFTKVVRVIDQFVSRTRGAGAAVLGTRLLPQTAERLRECIRPVSDLRADFGVVSEQMREEVDVYKAYLGMLLNIAGSSCSETFYFDQTRDGVLGPVLEMLVSTIGTSGELGLSQVALQILGRMTQLWVNLAPEEYGKRKHQHFPPAAAAADGAAEIPAHVGQVARIYEEMLFNDLCPRILDAMAAVSAPPPDAAAGTPPKPAMDLKDGKNYVLIGELCVLLKGLVMRAGEAGLYRLFESIMGKIASPPSQLSAHTMCMQLKAECCNNGGRPSVQAATKASVKDMLSEMQQMRIVLLQGQQAAGFA